MAKKKIDEVLVDNSIGETNTTVDIDSEILSGNPPRLTFTYPVPSTKEDYLALYQCLKDSNINSIGDVEVKASKL